MELSSLLTDPTAMELMEYAARCAPAECCGFVEQTAAARLILWPIENVARDRTRTFLMHPLDACGFLGRPTLVALFHSHPSSRPDLSAADVQCMETSGLPMVIIGLQPTVEIRLYRREEATFRCAETWRPHELAPL